jgi:hypothetical protein
MPVIMIRSVSFRSVKKDDLVGGGEPDEVCFGRRFRQIVEQDKIFA